MSAEDKPEVLRFQAAVQDKVAELRKRDGLPAGEAIAKAHQLRVQADLIEQGVPVDVAKRL